MHCANCGRAILRESRNGYIHMDGTWGCGKEFADLKAEPRDTPTETIVIRDPGWPWPWLLDAAEAVTEADEGHAGQPCPECSVYYGEHMANCSLNPTRKANANG